MATKPAAIENSFRLHPQLEADCILITELPLCRVLLLNDSRYPWLVLVPQRAGISEVYSLTDSDQLQLWQEVARCGKSLMQHHSGHKLNIGALGNMVPQLHLHVIVRDPADAAWPGPVWGVGDALPYSKEQLASLVRDYAALLEPIRH